MQTTLQGKLKKTIPEKCEICNVNLQLRILDTRVVSATKFVVEEIVVCPRCGNTTKLKPTTRRTRVEKEEE